MTKELPVRMAEENRLGGNNTHSTPPWPSSLTLKPTALFRHMQLLTSNTTHIAATMPTSMTKGLLGPLASMLYEMLELWLSISALQWPAKSDEFPQSVAAAEWLVGVHASLHLPCSVPGTTPAACHTSPGHA